MNVAMENQVETIDQEKIVLDAKGVYPRRLIIKDGKWIEKEYRLVRTQIGRFSLQK